MNDDSPFDFPEISDKAIRGASRLLGLGDEAFHGQDGTDPRQEVLKSNEGKRKVLRQRFGDANQAIFHSDSAEEATTDRFPNGMIKELPNSHRFGEKIARLAAPLGITPYSGGLKGQGPTKKSLISGVPEGRHTIFLFDDDSVTKVLDAYGALLLKTFSEEELQERSRDGCFTAVGHVHVDKSDNDRPRHVWSTTHTHSATHVGPQNMGRLFAGTLGDRFSIQHDTAYWARVTDVLVKGIQDARSRLEPARLGIGSGTAHANVNRRQLTADGRTVLGVNPDGAVDRQLGLIRLERRNGELIGLIANYDWRNPTFAGTGPPLSTRPQVSMQNQSHDRTDHDEDNLFHSACRSAGRALGRGR